MPRPRTVSDEAILDGVLALAHRIGPANVTFASAAREVGLSAATLVQRFGTKRDLLLAADRRAIDHWVGAIDRSNAPSPLERVVEGLIHAVDPDVTPAQMANSVAFLQLDLAEADFHAATLAGARAVRAKIADQLTQALTAGDLRADTDTDALAKLVETTYHGALIGWSIHRDGKLSAWLRDQLESVLAPWRTHRQSEHRPTSTAPTRTK